MSPAHSSYYCYHSWFSSVMIVSAQSDPCISLTKLEGTHVLPSTLTWGRRLLPPASASSIDPLDHHDATVARKFLSLADSSRGPTTAPDHIQRRRACWPPSAFARHRQNKLSPDPADRRPDQVAVDRRTERGCQSDLPKGAQPFYFRPLEKQTPKRAHDRAALHQKEEGSARSSSAP